MGSAKEREVDRAVYKLELERFRDGLAVVTPVVLGEGAALFSLAAHPSAYVAALTVLSLAVAGIALVALFVARVRPRPPSVRRTGLPG